MNQQTKSSLLTRTQPGVATQLHTRLVLYVTGLLLIAGLSYWLLMRAIGDSEWLSETGQVLVDLSDIVALMETCETAHREAMRSLDEGDLSHYRSMRRALSPRLDRAKALAAEHPRSHAPLGRMLSRVDERLAAHDKYLVLLGSESAASVIDAVLAESSDAVIGGLSSTVLKSVTDEEKVLLQRAMGAVLGKRFAKRWDLEGGLDDIKQFMQSDRVLELLTRFLVYLDDLRATEGAFMEDHDPVLLDRCLSLCGGIDRVFTALQTVVADDERWSARIETMGPYVTQRLRDHRKHIQFLQEMDPPEALDQILQQTAWRMRRHLREDTLEIVERADVEVKKRRADMIMAIRLPLIMMASATVLILFMLIRANRHVRASYRALLDTQREEEERLQMRADRLKEANRTLQHELDEGKRAQDELRRLTAVVRDSNDAVTMQSMDGKITAWNHGAEVAYGWSGDEAIGRSIEIIVPPSKIEEARDLVERLARGQPLESFETQRITRRENVVDVWITVTTLTDKMGRLVGIATTERDITARKRAQEELDRQSQELARSNQELEQFAYVASHDLQEPLRMVSSYVQLLERRYGDQLDDNAKEFIQFAVDGAKRMHRLIHDLLAYSRVGTRAKPFESIDMEQTLDEVLTNLQIAIKECGAVVTRGPLPTVMGEPGQISLVLQNLVGNAIKYRTDRTPEIHVDAEQKGDEWEFSVRDNGIGMDPKYKDRIFVIFKRLHTKQEYSGTGIGLAIVKKIVERHGGGISVETEEDKGSEFRFTMPVNGAST